MGNMLRPGLHTHSRPRAKSPLSTASCLPTTQPAPHPLRPGLSQKWTQSKPSRPARRQPGEWPRRGWLGGTTGSFDVLPEAGDLFPQQQEEGVGLAGAWRHLNVRDIDKPPPTQASASGRTSSCPCHSLPQGPAWAPFARDQSCFSVPAVDLLASSITVFRLFSHGCLTPPLPVTWPDQVKSPGIGPHKADPPGTCRCIFAPEPPCVRGVQGPRSSSETVPFPCSFGCWKPVAYHFPLFFSL